MTSRDFNRDSIYSAHPADPKLSLRISLTHTSWLPF